MSQMGTEYTERHQLLSNAQNCSLYILKSFVLRLEKNIFRHCSQSKLSGSRLPVQNKIMYLF